MSSSRTAGMVGSAPPVNTPTECPPSPALSTRSNFTATLSVMPAYPSPDPAAPGPPEAVVVPIEGEGEPVPQAAGLALLAEHERRLERPDLDPVRGPGDPGLERPVGQQEVGAVYPIDIPWNGSPPANPPA